MNRVYCMGEMLIDFTGVNIDGRVCFIRNAGGAPANVCVCVSRLGGKSNIITKLGDDIFGKFLYKTLEDEKIAMDYAFLTSEYKTALAFVSLDEKGDRSFTFYRDNSADMMLSSKEIGNINFDNSDILHFGSVDLVDSPSLDAHKYAIEKAIKSNSIISFDPNLRYRLWKSRESLLTRVREFLPYAHILKVNDEELKDITNLSDEEKGAKALLNGNTQIVFVTRGENGSAVYTKNGKKEIGAKPVKCVDTTGAGDSFIGTILYLLKRDNILLKDLSSIDNKLDEYLYYANEVSSFVVGRKGAIPSMPYHNQVF